jgi:SRSO17 transposase
MDRRFERRKEQMLAECEVDPGLLRDAGPRLASFLAPFQRRLAGDAPRQHAVEYAQGLVSNLKRKNVESIAYQLDQDRRNLQHFIGTAKWDHAPLVDELCSQVGSALGEADGVIVIDPSGFPKQGKKSVGVARQWCGRVGKVDNCQLAVFLAYVSRREHALCDFELYLPKEWTNDRRRCRAAGVPGPARHRTRHEMALEMIRRRRGVLPHLWVTADDEFGKVGHFRRDLHEMNERYLLAVPHNLTARILDGDALPRRGAGQPKPPPFVPLETIRNNLPRKAWKRIKVRDGDKGPLLVEIAVIPRVQAKAARRHLRYAETAVFIRYSDAQGTRHDDYYLSDAAPDTPRAEFARVASAERRVEECIRRAKSETGLADYEVRNWRGWHHHQTLSLIAAWFLVQETRRGKKIDAGAEPAATATDHRLDAGAPMEPYEAVLDCEQREPSLAA